MTSILLAAAFVLLVAVGGLLAYLVATEGIWNFQRIWERALEGHRVARWYMWLVVIAFLTAVAAWVSAFVDHRAKAASMRRRVRSPWCAKSVAW